MSVTAPPRPPQPSEPSHDELQALIEAARRRARRRRLVIAGAIATGLATAGVLVAAVLMIRGGERSSIPPGFHAVRAKGPVSHALIEYLDTRAKAIDLRTGEVRALRDTEEIWWDPASGLERSVRRNGRQVVFDAVSQHCQGGGPQRFCFPPSPFDLHVKGLTWPPRPNAARIAGRSRFRGRVVVWMDALVQPGEGQKPYPSGDQVAFDPRSHRPVGARSRVHGRFMFRQAFSLLPSPPKSRVEFVVPDAGAPRNLSLAEADVQASDLARARNVLGQDALWLGRSYGGQRLQVETGRLGMTTQKGGPVGLVPFVRLHYGKVTLEEFDRRRPTPWFKQPPPTGVAFGSLASNLVFTRNGVFVHVLGAGGTDAAAVLRLVRALRPAAGE